MRIILRSSSTFAAALCGRGCEMPPANSFWAVLVAHRVSHACWSLPTTPVLHRGWSTCSWAMREHLALTSVLASKRDRRGCACQTQSFTRMHIRGSSYVRTRYNQARLPGWQAPERSRSRPGGGYVTSTLEERAHADVGARGGSQGRPFAVQRLLEQMQFHGVRRRRAPDETIGDEEYPYAQGKLCARGCSYSQITIRKDHRPAQEGDDKGRIRGNLVGSGLQRGSPRR